MIASAFLSPRHAIPVVLRRPRSFAISRLCCLISLSFALLVGTAEAFSVNCNPNYPYDFHQTQGRFSISRRSSPNKSRKPSSIRRRKNIVPCWLWPVEQQAQRETSVLESLDSGDQALNVQVLHDFVQDFLTKKASHWNAVDSDRRINLAHTNDFKVASFVSEKYDHVATPKKSTTDLLPYQPVTVGGDEDGNDSVVIGLRSLKPMLNASSITTIRQAAEAKWRQTQLSDGNSNGTTSRFTYQRPGNYEAHASDLGGSVRAIMNRLLLEQIYPMVRAYFFEDKCNELFVYDSLYIRYNATEAEAAAAAVKDHHHHPANKAIGAGQPLHRDLGIVSVNIMLNDANEFEGGGTFFENQLLCDREKEDKQMTTLATATKVSSGGGSQNILAKAIEPLKPIGSGCSLAHFSSERHAGAGTISGVRDILVIFVSAVQYNNSGGIDDEANCSFAAPGDLKAALLKQSCTHYCHQQQQQSDGSPPSPEACALCRIFHSYQAALASPADGEAYQYLGKGLMEYAENIAATAMSKSDDDQEHNKNNVAEESRRVLEAAIMALHHAAQLTPCDARVFDHLGKSLLRLEGCGGSNSRQHQQTDCNDNKYDDSLVSETELAFAKALELLNRSLRAGCDVVKELENVRLTYGLYLANKDAFQSAAKILGPNSEKKKKLLSMAEPPSADRRQILDDSERLFVWCKKMAAKKNAQQQLTS